MLKLEKFFSKHKLNADKILYIYRNNKKTVICSESGEETTTLIPIHELHAFLPEGLFISIAKGVIVNRSRIVHIGDDGVYTMTDGKTFQGRQRYLSFHKKLRRELNLNHSVCASRDILPPLSFLEKCTVVDNMPLAYCVIELVFDENGHGVDFIFRYCNKHMEVVEGIPLEEMLNHSFYEVFKNGDKKWLITYADVALNGTKRTLHDYSPEIDKNLTIHCYQPLQGYCACVLVPEEPTPENTL